jgi:L-alanine-DL-glutamate epimerase-like enolase superfamily enzyme
MASEAPITGLRAAAYRIPTDGPEADGTLDWDATVMVAAHVEAGGETGFGYGYADRATAVFLRDVLWPVLEGRDPFDIPGAWRAMLDRVRNHGRQGVAAMALSVADLALHDLKARLLGMPLARLLGRRRESARVYGSGGFLTFSDDRLAEQVAGWAEDGFAAVKIKVGADLGTERRRMKIARHAAPDAALMIDANGACTRKGALALAEVAAHLGVTWFEEPVSSDDLAGLRLLRDRSRLAIAAGEYGWDAFHFRTLLEAGAVDILQADVTRCGGITGLLQADALAFAHNVPLSIHCAPAVSLAPALALQRLIHMEWFADHARIESMLLDGAPTPVNGTIAPDLSRPGHGLTLKAQDAEPYRLPEAA